MNVDIKEKLYKDISDYCKANHLVIKDYVNDLLKKQFMIDKYGEKPGVNKTTSNTQEIKKEVKIVEVADIKQPEPEVTEVVDTGVTVELVDEKKQEELVVEMIKEVDNTETQVETKVEEPVIKQTRKRKLK